MFVYQHSEGGGVADAADGVAEEVGVEGHGAAGTHLAHPVDGLGARPVSLRVELSHENYLLH